MADTNWAEPPTADTTWPRTCTVKWCQEDDSGGAHRHRRTVSVIAPERLEMDASVTLGLEAARDETEPHLVMGLGFTGRECFGAARLTWQQVERLAAGLLKVHRRWAP